jgi:hypothetical protein
MSYPVTVTVTPKVENRNRLTTAFRLILAIPHAILVGGVALGFAMGGNDQRTNAGGETGLLGAVAAFLAIVSWFTILFANSHLPGIRQFTAYYLRWRVRALSYLMLLTDDYPPFGDAPYPASVEVTDPPSPRDRLTVALRFLYAIPHFIVLVFVMLAWCVVTVIAWFAILFTGAYPAGLINFSAGALRWRLRVEAYLLLMVDAYPPFSLD